MRPFCFAIAPASLDESVCAGAVSGNVALSAMIASVVQRILYIVISHCAAMIKV